MSQKVSKGDRIRAVIEGVVERVDFDGEIILDDGDRSFYPDEVDTLNVLERAKVIHGSGSLLEEQYGGKHRFVVLDYGWMRVTPVADPRSTISRKPSFEFVPFQGGPLSREHFSTPRFERVN